MNDYDTEDFKIIDIIRLIPAIKMFPNIKILKTSSWSPCLFIVTRISESKEGCPLKKYGGETEIVIKAWPIIMNPDNTYHDRISGVEYEKNVYKNHIHPILERDRDAPFLRYLGDDNDCSTVESLTKLIYNGGINGIILNFFSLSFFILERLTRENDVKKHFQQYLKNTKCSFDFNEYNFYYYYFKCFPDEILRYNNHKKFLYKLQIGAIITPSIKFRYFEDIIGTNIQIDCFKQLIHGLYILFLSKIVHNDLHAKNIMIEEGTNKVLIYDWDRSYVRGQDNKLLGNDPCEDGYHCYISQCNIFFDDGRPVDLIKILCYIAHREPGILNRYLSEGLNIKNVMIDGKTKYDIIREDIREVTKTNCFYNVEGCSVIYKVNHSKNLENLISHLGKWDIIANRASINSAENKEIDDPYLKLEMEKYSDQIYLNITLQTYINSFSFTSTKNIDYYTKPYSYTENSIISKKLKSADKKIIEKLRLGIDIDTKTMNNIKKLTKYPLTHEMISDFNRIKNKEKLSISDYIILKDIYEYIKYGLPVDFELSEEKDILL